MYKMIYGLDFGHHTRGKLHYQKMEVKNKEHSVQ